MAPPMRLTKASVAGSKVGMFSCGCGVKEGRRDGPADSGVVGSAPQDTASALKGCATQMTGGGAAVRSAPRPRLHQLWHAAGGVDGLGERPRVDLAHRRRDGAGELVLLANLRSERDTRQRGEEPAHVSFGLDLAGETRHEVDPASGEGTADTEACNGRSGVGCVGGWRIPPAGNSDAPRQAPRRSSGCA